MCAKCNEHKYGLFSGVSVAPAAILSKVNFLTGSQVFYSCCTTPLYICCTTPPLFINMVILAVSPSLAGAFYGNVQTKKLCENGKQPLKSPLLAQLYVGKFDQIVNYLIQNEQLSFSRFIEISWEKNQGQMRRQFGGESIFQANGCVQIQASFSQEILPIFSEG